MSRRPNEHHDHDPDERKSYYEEMSWWGFVTAGMSREQLKGAFIMSWRAGMLAAVLGAYGMFKPVGFDGFAYASEQVRLVDATVATRVEGLEARMFDLRVKQCEALKAGESPRVFTVQLQQIVDKYRDITRREPNLPVCAELN